MTDVSKFTYATNHADPLVASLAAYPGFVETVLLSERYTTAATLRRVGLAKSLGVQVISDNGNFSRMSKVATRFKARAAKLVAEAEAQRAATGVVGDALMLQRALLWETIVDACRIEQEKKPFAAILEKQLLCVPGSLIGLEDFVVPVLTMLGLLTPLFVPQADRVRPYQEATLALYTQQAEGAHGGADALALIRKFLVLHSYDYPSAHQAAANALGAHIDGIAISFGGPMASKAYIPSIAIGGTTRAFASKLPEPYLIACAILAGVNKGLQDKTLPVHILGLGSPILIVLLGYLLRDSRAVSIDATSTFKDADDGTIYACSPAFLKLDMYKVAAFALLRNEPYQIDSPTFLEFEKKHPADWDALRVELQVKPTDVPTKVAALLRANPQALERLIPYFTPARKGTDALIKAVRVARSGSNYWVLQQICTQVRGLNGNQALLRAWLDGEVTQYTQVASPNWGRAVMEIVKWIDLFHL